MWRKVFFIACLAFACCALLLNIQGCKKEYSYELQPVDTTGTEPDSTDTIPNSYIYYQCPQCEKDPGYVMGKWSFMIDSVSFCGIVTGEVMLSERTAFTFFGPSACSEDSGLIITCYMDEPFAEEALYISVDLVTLRYYNHPGAKDMLQADAGLGFALVIQSYSKNNWHNERYFQRKCAYRQKYN
jgi:hypothetical protein